MDNIQKEIENKVIDCIARGSGGRLVVFKPENSEAILIVEKKGHYSQSKQIILRVSGGADLKKGFTEEVLLLSGNKDFPADENFYLVFVRFNIVKQNLEEDFLVIPSLNLCEIKEEKDLQKFLTTKNDFVRLFMQKL